MTKPRARTLIERLSKRQLQVLRGIASSRTADYIADDLGICLQTVYHHRRKLVEALGLEAHDTAALTRIAMRAGVVK